jgi:hypothetical protein
MFDRVFELDATARINLRDWCHQTLGTQRCDLNTGQFDFEFAERVLQRRYIFAAHPNDT